MAHITKSTIQGVPRRTYTIDFQKVCVEKLTLGIRAMSMEAIQLKNFQDGGIAGYTGSRY